MSEQWRPVAGFRAGCYEVSDRGRVRSLDKLDRRGIFHPGKVLKPDSTKDGHLRVTLCVDHARHRRFVHRLMWEAFVGPIPDGMLIRHRNDVPDDNRLGNLDLGTVKDNVGDAIALGSHCGAATHCPHGHRYDEANTCIKKDGRRSCRACAREYMRRRRRGLVADIEAVVI